MKRDLTTFFMASFLICFYLYLIEGNLISNYYIYRCIAIITIVFFVFAINRVIYKK
jgi:uncharacterized membrane protein